MEACQVPLSMAVPWQEFCSGLSFPSPKDLPDPKIKHLTLASPSLVGELLTTEPPGKPFHYASPQLKS